MNLQGRNLSINLAGQDVRLLQSELQQLGFQIPDNELQKSAFGQGTLAAVTQFQNQNKLQATGIVDGATAKAINTRVDALKPSLVVEGQVRLADSKPLAGVTVAAIDQNLRAEKALGMTVTDANGR